MIEVCLTDDMGYAVHTSEPLTWLRDKGWKVTARFPALLHGGMAAIADHVFADKVGHARHMVTNAERVKLGELLEQLKAHIEESLVARPVPEIQRLVAEFREEVAAAKRGQ